MKVFKYQVNIVILLICVGFTACRNGNHGSNSTCSITLLDSYNRSVIIPNKPSRIISAAPSITEIIFAIGQGSKLVGRTDYCKFPAAVSKIPSIGGLEDPSIETIVNINPDLMIASSHFKKETVEQLDQLKVPIVIEKEDASFDGVFRMINRIGEILNAKPKADSVIFSMKSKIVLVGLKVKSVKIKPSVYVVIGFGKTGDYTAGGNTFISEMIGMSGGENIAKSITGWAFSLEKLIQLDPDIILIRKGDKELFCATDNYKMLKAVKNNRVVEIDNDLLELPGPRLADGLVMLLGIIHPEFK